LFVEFDHEHQNYNTNCYMNVKTFKLDHLSNGYMSRFTPSFRTL